jgi:hypothetical protein
MMNREMLFIGGASLGAGLMYILDPDLGRRRRALIRDQCVGKLRSAASAIDKTRRDMRQRAQGVVSELRNIVTGDGAPDVVVEERVRSKMGRFVSHPGAIDVAVHEGRVDLGGHILADEVQDFVSAVRGTRGVRAIENHLDVRREAGNLSELQGGRRPPGEHWNVNETNWAPATRFLAAAAGGALLTYGATQRFPVACALGSAGLGLLGMAARKNTSADTDRARGDTRRSGKPEQAG